jgi:hypothetical protein
MMGRKPFVGELVATQPAVTATFRDSSPVALCSSRIDTLGDTAYSRVLV